VIAAIAANRRRSSAQAAVTPLNVELFSNPNFDTADLSEWAASAATVSGSVASAQLNVANAGPGWFYRKFKALTAGTYNFAGTFVAKASGGRLYVGSAVGNGSYLAVSIAGSSTITITHPGGDLYVSLGDAAGGTDTNVYDAFSLKRTA